MTEAVRSEKFLTLQVEANLVLKQDRGMADPFDGMVEYYWDNAASLMEIYTTEEAQAALKEMTEYQKKFVDFAHSAGFFTEG